MAEEQILCIQLRQLGDILLTTPCLRAIKKERPKARLTFLSHSMGQLILDQSPDVDEHFFYEKDAKPIDEWRIARRIRARRYDLVIDFMNNPRSAFYTLASGGAERIAFKSARWPVYSRTVPRPRGGAYIVDEKFSLIEAAGFHPSPRDRQLILPWFEPHTKPLVRFWGQEAALKDAPLRVVLSPTHRRDLRRWPLSSYAALADKLVQTNHASVIWLWGPGEEALVEEAMSLCQTRTFRAPATNFREMAAFIANCDLFIGNSNGPSHVAVATRICSLQIHGPTNAASWCPMTPQHQALQAVRGRMEEISVEALWEKLESMRPELEAFAAKRRTAGLRLNWRDP